MNANCHDYNIVYPIRGVGWHGSPGLWAFGRGAYLLAGYWLPKFDFVSFGIGDPAEFAEFGFFDLPVDLDAFCAEHSKQGRQIVHAIVDHERRRAGSKVVRVCRE